MGKEFDAMEISNAMIADTAESSVTQLNELSLVLISGGFGTVTF